MPLSPTSWNKANRVKWTLGTFASKAFAHYGYGPWCSKNLSNITESTDFVAAQHTISSHWVSAEQAPGDVNEEQVFFFESKNTWKFPGHSFLIQKSKPKKWRATDFFQLMEAMKSTNALRIGLRLSDQPVFGAVYILREKTWRAWCVLKGLPRRIPCPQLTCP